jgi:hypothetical protein
VGAALDQLHASGALDVSDVLGHRRLADAKLLRRRRKGSAPGEGRERSQPRFQIHNLGLYGSAALCISVLSAYFRTLSARRAVKGRARKSGDNAAHRWGLESLEAREALRAQDAPVSAG